MNLPPPQVSDPIHDLHTQLSISARRLQVLETEVEHEALVIIQSQSEQVTFSENFSRELEELRRAQDELRADVRAFLNDLAKVSTRFHGTVKKNSITAVQRRVDAWNLEELMPKEQFEREIKKRFV